MSPAATPFRQRSLIRPRLDETTPMAVTATERSGCRSARWAFAILIAGSLVGDVMMPAAIERFPLLLILLSPRWRMLLLVSRRLNPGLLVSVGFARRLLTILVAHRVGTCGIGRTQTSGAPMRPAPGRSRWFHGWFKRSSAALLVVFPGAAAAVLAGMERIGSGRVVALASVGTAVRLLILLHVGKAFAGPLEQVIRFLGAHHLQITGLILMCIVIRAFRTFGHSGPRPLEEPATVAPSEQLQPSLERV
jgi:hypothetical protein